MCTEPAIRFGFAHPGQIFYAPMSNLKFSTTYYYQFGDKINGFSALFLLRTPPRAGDPIRTVVFGDYVPVLMSFHELLSWD